MTIDTPDWVRDAVFYQIFPDRFAASERVSKPGPLEPWEAPPTNHGFKGGDLLGIVERLPYLADLGINALYLTPIFASASNHRYHTYDYFRVDPLLGGDDALRELLDAAHARDIRVVLDGVFNHTGRGFWAFHHVLETGGASPYRNWFHFDQAGLDAGKPVVAYPGVRPSGVGLDEPLVGETEPPGSGSSVRRFGYQAWWDMPALPKLNTDDPGVRAHLFAAAEHWIRFGIDGWRLDVPEEIRDEAFWQEFRRRVRALNPEAYLVGEIWRVAPEWLRGDRFDALMNYPLAEAILSFVGAGHLNETVLRSHHEYGPHVHELDGVQFADRLQALMTAYAPDVVASQLNLLDSHDTPRFHSLVDGDRASYRMAVFLQASLPGAPCIYYGDEIGLDGGIDPDCRRGFPRDEAARDDDLLAFVRAAIALRHAEPALRRGGFEVIGSAGKALAFERSLGPERLVIGVNAGASPALLRVDVSGATGPRLSPVALPGMSPGEARIEEAGRFELELPPRSGTVFRTT